MLEWSTICFGIGLILFLLVKWDVIQGILYSLSFDSMGVSLYLIQEASRDFNERFLMTMLIPVGLFIIKWIFVHLITLGWRKRRCTKA